jgi:ParB-like chromosome segregation protein Spo0J
MQIKKVKIKSLKQDPQNARLHDNRNLEAIQTSLEAFGQQKPIVINGEKQIIAGNGTVKAAEKIGWEEIAVIETELNTEEAIAFAIADNRTAELATWNVDTLAELYESLSVPMRNAAAFTDAEIKKLLGSESDTLRDIDDNLDAVEYRVIVSVEGPDQQAELIEELEGRGLGCLPLMS